MHDTAQDENLEEETETTLSIDDGDETDQQAEDRGDEIEPKLDPEALKAIAGDDQDEDEAGEDEPEPGSKTVPHGRFNEVNEKRKVLEEENARLQAELQALRTGKQPPEPEPEPEQPPFDLEAKELAAADAMFMGDQEKYAKIRGEINAYLLQTAEDHAAARITRDLTVKEERSLLQTEAAAAYEAYPFLDAASKAANQQAIQDVVDLRDVYFTRGEPLHIALRKAVERVGPMYADEPAETKRDPANLAHLAKLRQSEGVRRGADASTRQPPALRGVGEREANLHKLDIEKMPDEKFDTLPESELKRLRGD